MKSDRMRSIVGRGIVLLLAIVSVLVMAWPVLAHDSGSSFDRFEQSIPRTTDPVQINDPTDRDVGDNDNGTGTGTGTGNPGKTADLN